MLDLNQQLHDSDNRPSIYKDSFQKIRKAYHEYRRWVPFTRTKSALDNAFAEFRGSRISEKEIRKEMAGSSKEQINTFLTSVELNCISPAQTDYYGFMGRIDKRVINIIFICLAFKSITIIINNTL